MQLTITSLLSAKLAKMAAHVDINDPKHEMRHIEQVTTTNDDEPIKPVMEKVDEFGAHDKTDPREIRLVRKMDWYIMVGVLFGLICKTLVLMASQPILWAMYFMNFLDRNAMVNGKLNNLSKDLKLKGTEYNTCVSILFVGYASIAIVEQRRILIEV